MLPTKWAHKHIQPERRLWHGPGWTTLGARSRVLASFPSLLTALMMRIGIDRSGWSSAHQQWNSRFPITLQHDTAAKRAFLPLDKEGDYSTWHATSDLNEDSPSVLSSLIRPETRWIFLRSAFCDDQIGEYTPFAVHDSRRSVRVWFRDLFGGNMQMRFLDKSTYNERYNLLYNLTDEQVDTMF